MNKFKFFVQKFVFIFSFILFAAQSAFAAPGDLDASFGTGGFLDLGGINAQVRSVQLLEDGKILASGSSQALLGGNYEIMIYRSDAVGVLDTYFMFSFGGSIESGDSLALQSDGKIVVAGTSNSWGNEFALLRLNSDGSLDSSFDIDGQKLISFGGTGDVAKSTAIQSDGKIVVAGYSNSGGNNQFALLRLNSDGSLDSSFDGDGQKLVSFGGVGDVAQSMVIQSDGKIVVSGYSNFGVHNQFSLARLNSDGSLDSSFDSDGLESFSFSSNKSYQVRSLVLQEDGKIIAVGYGVGGSDEIVIARLEEDGSLDATFDEDGKKVFDSIATTQKAHAVLLQSDGKIVMAGELDGSPALFRLDGNSADVSIVETADLSTVNVGSNITYTLTVTNAGPDESGLVTVTDALPSNLTFVSVTPSTGSCTGTSSIVCNLGTLDNAATATIAIVATANAVGNIDNLATVDAGQVVDANSNNDSSTLSVVASNVEAGNTGGGSGCFLTMNSENYAIFSYGWFLVLAVLVFSKKMGINNK